VTHTVRQKAKLVNRVRRLEGQVKSVERALAGEAECVEVMRLLAACRGAVSSLLAEVIEDHVREHLVGSGGLRGEARGQAADELIEVVHSYFK
jgi:FrmR/RcnR family transcriptional regulator, repressor of frmRAB operon